MGQEQELWLHGDIRQRDGEHRGDLCFDRPQSRRSTETARLRWWLSTTSCPFRFKRPHTECQRCWWLISNAGLNATSPTNNKSQSLTCHGEIRFRRRQQPPSVVEEDLLLPVRPAHGLLMYNTGGYLCCIISRTSILSMPKMAWPCFRGCIPSKVAPSTRYLARRSHKELDAKQLSQPRYSGPDICWPSQMPVWSNINLWHRVSCTPSSRKIAPWLLTTGATSELESDTSSCSARPTSSTARGALPSAAARMAMAETAATM